LKEAWNKDEIENLENRLFVMQSELHSQVLVGLMAKVDVNELKQAQSFAVLEKDIQDLVDTLLEIHVEASRQIEVETSRVCDDMQRSSQATQCAIEDASRTNKAALS
jgi:hypothetical protein